MKFKINFDREKYLKLIDLVITKFDFQKTTINRCIVELRYDEKTIVVRMGHVEDDQNVFLSFYHGLNPIDIITIYDFVRSICPDIIIGATFYINESGELIVGSSRAAKAAFEDLVAHITNADSRLENSYNKEKFH